MTPLALFTDYGMGNLYVGQLHWRLARQGINFVDLAHDAPRFHPLAAGHLLRALLAQMQDPGVLVAVVDPGVGGSRGAVRVDWRGWRLVGPDNGLFAPLAETGEVDRVVSLDPSRFRCSNTFHGRDWFVPVGIELAQGRERDQGEIPGEALVGFGERSWLERVIYVDGFGNLMTGLAGSSLKESDRIEIGGKDVGYLRTFCEAAAGGLLWYRNSIGLVEVAANQASASALLGAGIGTSIRVVD